MTEPQAHEEGRKLGLSQAATHLRGEVAKLRVLQQREGFDRQRDKLITKLLTLAKNVEGLK